MLRSSKLKFDRPAKTVSSSNFDWVMRTFSVSLEEMEPLMFRKFRAKALQTSL